MKREEKHNEAYGCHMTASLLRFAHNLLWSPWLQNSPARTLVPEYNDEGNKDAFAKLVTKSHEELKSKHPIMLTKHNWSAVKWDKKISTAVAEAKLQEQWQEHKEESKRLHEVNDGSRRPLYLTEDHPWHTKIRTGMRTGWNELNGSRKAHGQHDQDGTCDCDHKTDERPEHVIMECRRYAKYRSILKHKLRHLGIPWNKNIILADDRELKPYDLNTKRTILHLTGHYLRAIMKQRKKRMEKKQGKDH